jgi:Putative metallopeptidase
MMNPQAIPELEAKDGRHVAIGRRALRASRLGAGVGVLLVLVASCMVPGPYQQGPYQQGGYQQGQDQQGQAQGQVGAAGMSPAAQAQAQVGMRVVYEPPTKNREHEQIRTYLQQTEVFEQTSTVMNLVFRFPQAVTIVWTECGAVNAAWDGQGNIVMCYELAGYLKTLFSKRIRDRKQLRVAVMSSLMFTFLHELGHALISMYKIPAVGREEDAADQLAALVLISTGRDGVEVAMHGAQFFRLLAASGSQTPFFDEHSLDAQRYYNVMCLVYGSNPQQYASLVGHDKLPAERARRCSDEYSKISSAWASLLKDSSRSGQQASSQPGWQQRPAAPARDSEDDGYEDDPSGSGDAPAPTSHGSSSDRGNTSWWLCTAEGSIGTAYGDEPFSYSTETAYGGGPTRDQAYRKALEDCNALISMASSLAISWGQRRDGGTCSVVSCIGPGRVR